MAVIQVDMFLGQFALAALSAVIWLLVCHAIRALRRRKGLCYGIAGSIALLTCLLPVAPLSELTWSRFAASLAVAVMLYLHRRGALRKQSLETNTIISYENSIILRNTITRPN